MNCVDFDVIFYKTLKDFHIIMLCWKCSKFGFFLILSIWTSTAAVCYLLLTFPCPFQAGTWPEFFLSQCLSPFCLSVTKNSHVLCSGLNLHSCQVIPLPLFLCFFFTLENFFFSDYHLQQVTGISLNSG